MSPTTGQDHRHLLAAARLVDDIDGQRHREQVSFEEGYRAGYDAGYEVGQAHAEAEMRRQWEDLAAQVRAAGLRRTTAEHAELDATAAAGEPCAPKCGTCSRCIRAAAVTRRGGDYDGGPTPWEAATAAQGEQGAA